MFERFITVGYYALVDFTKVSPVPDIISDACEWFSIYDIPEMILDHRHIFEEALQTVRELFDYALTVGFNLNFVDIGGGFHGHDLSLLDHYAKYINRALDNLFPGDFYEIISEPGRYFVSSAFTLICNIHSKKIIRDDDGSIKKIHYFINDALYQSFMGTFLDHNPVKPRLMNGVKKSGPKYDSMVWGNTCDPVDKVTVDWPSEELNICKKP